MSVLEILQYPDERLRVKTKPITKFNAELHQQINDMYETMYHYQGIGLAGPQVNFPYQIFVMDVSENRKQPLCIINPEILDKHGERIEDEGCLSLPGVYAKVQRAFKVRLRAINAEGKSFEMDAEDLMSHCIQHEMDHLEGILFIDHLSRLKQDRLRKKLSKQSREPA
jgi:peptide deformylase